MRLAPFATAALAILVTGLLAARLFDLTTDRTGRAEATGQAGSRLLVDDAASLLTPQQRQRIGTYHAALLADYDIDFRVAIVPGAPDVNLAAADRFAELEIGHLSASGRGLLLLIAPDSDKLRIEVGRSLEPVVTDAFVAYVENRQMVPFFRSGRVADGILATTELIAQHAGEGIRTGAFADPANGAAEPSAGAGARTAAQIGAGYLRPQGPAGELSAEGLSPRAVVEHYLSAMAAGNANPDLTIYTAATRDMMRGWVVTPAQMRQIAGTYRQCRPPRLFQAAARAVLRYASADRACAPFFLRRTGDVWQIDLTMMSGAIRFNHRNQWRFAAGPPSEFAFAFADWAFDAHGFPRK